PRAVGHGGYDGRRRGPARTARRRRRTPPEHRVVSTASRRTHNIAAPLSHRKEKSPMMKGRTLLAAERHDQILEILTREGAVRISELVDKLGVSTMTIRRDLAFLEREDKLHRVHGGAVRVHSFRGDREITAKRLCVLGPRRDVSWLTVARAAEQRAVDLGYDTIAHPPVHRSLTDLTSIERLVESDGVNG